MRRIALSVLGTTLLACAGLLPIGPDKNPGDTTPTLPTTDTTTDPTDPPGPPTGDTGPGTTTTTEPPTGGDFEPYVAYMSATLVWDASTNSVRSVDVDGTVIPSGISIVIGSKTFAESTIADPFTLTGEYCVVDLLIPNGPAPQSALDDATTYRVVDHSGDVADVSTTCDPAQYPMDAFIGAGADLVDTLLDAPGRPWALGVGQLAASAVSDLDQIGATSAVFDTWTGGRVFNSSFFFADVIVDDGWVTRPFRVDPVTFEALVDGGGYLVYIPLAQVSNGTNLATGWYDMFPVYGVLLQ